MPSVGPHINLSQAAKRKREAQDEGDKGDQMVSGPSSSSSSLSNSASVSSFSPTKKPRTIGPTLPPASLEERPLQPPDSDTDSSSSDEEIGPGLPADNPQKLEMPTGSSSAVSAGSSALAHGKSERDEWMIVPPSSDDWTSRVDPTKLKNRKFNTGKGSKGQGQTICKGSNASWTETPDERRARLQREMMGTKEISTAKDPPQDTSEIRENAKKLREYNEKSRGATLYKEHQKTKGHEKEDDPSARAFDREKDIVGGKVNHTERREWITKAADFGSRFNSGKFL